MCKIRNDDEQMLKEEKLQELFWRLNLEVVMNLYINFLPADTETICKQAGLLSDYIKAELEGSYNNCTSCKKKLLEYRRVLENCLSINF